MGLWPPNSFYLIVEQEVSRAPANGALRHVVVGGDAPGVDFTKQFSAAIYGQNISRY
jgi:hypothetical protein